MLRFFRLIRRKLIEEQKVRQYIYYGIGEILLVVIGIVIALQINTWNEGRKRSNLEKYLLKELKMEVSENLILINEDIETNLTGLNHSLALIDLILAGNLEDDVRLTDSLVAGVYEMSNFEPKSGVITDIINTGKLDVISNDSLRLLISNWDFQIIDILDDARIRDNNLFEYLFPFLSSNYPLMNIHEFIKPYLESSEMSESWPDKKSALSPNYDRMYSLEAQGLVYNHAINQEYLLNALRTYRSYLEGMKSLISKELEDA